MKKSGEVNLRHLDDDDIKGTSSYDGAMFILFTLIFMR
jgi:hypothetical protein